MVSLGIIVDHFGAKLAQSVRNNPPLEMAFHSEWLRNNPKGPHGPIPQRAPKAPLGPFGPLGPFWPLVLGSPGPLGGGMGVGSLGCLWVQGIGTL